MNYKVDFKTKIMEWKTKYNWLVDEVLNKKVYKHVIKLTLAFTVPGTGGTSITKEFDVYSSNGTEFKSSDMFEIVQVLSVNGRIQFRNGNWYYLEKGFSVYSGWSLVSFNRNQFINTPFSYIGMKYPSDTPKIYAFDKDTINLETGEMNSRTNLATNTSVTFVSDTVSEFN